MSTGQTENAKPDAALDPDRDGDTVRDDANGKADEIDDVAKEVDGPVDAVSPDQPIYCPQCGYDVRAASRGECPECGTGIDLAALCMSQIPWSYRAEVGRFASYWRTVWMVTFKTERFCEELVRPVDFQDAIRFRRVTVFLAFISILAIAGIPILLEERVDGLSELPRAFGPRMATILVVTEIVFLAFYLFLMTGVHTYWFHPARLDVIRQNRAVATSYYACAPLALLPIAAVFIGVGSVLFHAEALADSRTMEIVMGIGMFIGGITVLLAFMGFWLAVNRMRRRGTEPTGIASIAFTLGLPVLWLGLAFVTLVCLPVLVVMAWAMVQVVAR